LDHPPPAISDATGVGPNKIYHAGTLTYTKAALAGLFFWLLWGDFCYTVMESVTGPIMQLKFKHLDASNTEIGLIVGTIPNIVYSIFNPIISFKSDRFRSRWGRRIPFIFGGLPFLVIILVVLGFGDRLGLWLHGFLLTGVSANQVVILTLGVLLVIFTFLNTLVTSIYWYLFNDVVPEHLLARFMSWFRVISSASASFYSFFIFPYSGTHSRGIFVGAALLFLAGFGLMCLCVKEGKYPPPPPYDGGQTGPIAAIKTFGKETLSNSHYWYMWLFSFMTSMAAGTAIFGLFFALALGMSLHQIGIIAGCVSITASIMTIGAGWLADRYHPIRVVLVGTSIASLIIAPAGLIWLFWHPAPIIVFWVSLTTSICLSAPSLAMINMGNPTMLMRLLPRSRYGQFCSTNALWLSMGTIIGSGLTGVYLDIVTHFVGRERAYYYLPFWATFFSIPALFFLFKLYQSWKRYGGDENYVPPIRNVIGDPLPEPIPK
jgi:MFS family permease